MSYETERGGGQVEGNVERTARSKRIDVAAALHEGHIARLRRVELSVAAALAELPPSMLETAHARAQLEAAQEALAEIVSGGGAHALSQALGISSAEWEEGFRRADGRSGTWTAAEPLVGNAKPDPEQT